MLKYVIIAQTYPLQNILNMNLCYTYRIDIHQLNGYRLSNHQTSLLRELQDYIKRKEFLVESL
jgi:hypothetical protein